MTERSAIDQLVRRSRRSVAPSSPTSTHDGPKLHVHIADPKAKVMLLPGRYRGADYIRAHVAHVLSRPPEQGEAHVFRNLACIRENLEALGIARADVDAEVRRIESAVRAEIWRQVLTPPVGAA